MSDQKSESLRDFGGNKPEAEESTGRRRDPELQTMERMVRLLEEMESEARPRIMAWLNSRYAREIMPGLIVHPRENYRELT